MNIKNHKLHIVLLFVVIFGFVVIILHEKEKKTGNILNQKIIWNNVSINETSNIFYEIIDEDNIIFYDKKRPSEIIGIRKTDKIINESFVDYLRSKGYSKIDYQHSTFKKYPCISISYYHDGSDNYFKIIYLEDQKITFNFQKKGTPPQQNFIALLNNIIISRP